MFQKILLIEDSDHKLSRIRGFAESLWDKMELHEARSFNSGCKCIDADDFDLIILDMSLPTYDRTPADSGGRFRTFGGREIARKVIRRKIQTKMVFITQYDSFSDRVRSLSLDNLNSELASECGSSYLGLVKYDSAKSSWKDELKKMMGLS